MNGKRNLALGVSIVLVIVFCGVVWGQDIKSRMRDRLPAIVSLKTAGLIGENNQGYLTILKPPIDKESLVIDENNDRRIIYEAIAKNQGTTPELVGQRRALQIAEKADLGDWIQDANGHWQQK